MPKRNADNELPAYLTMRSQLIKCCKIVCFIFWLTFGGFRSFTSGKYWVCFICWVKLCLCSSPAVSGRVMKHVKIPSTASGKFKFDMSLGTGQTCACLYWHLVAVNETFVSQTNEPQPQWIGRRSRLNKLSQYSNKPTAVIHKKKNQLTWNNWILLPPALSIKKFLVIVIIVIQIY